MNSTQLKIIAIVTMLIDHTGAILFPDIIVLRMIGRLAFPIFAFLLVEGYFHTKNVRKYLIRLGVFALISEVAFDWAFYHKPFYVFHQNIFFTLFIALVTIWFFDQYKEIKPHIAWAVLIGGSMLSILLGVDYNILGIMSIFFFYRYHDERPRALFSVGLLHVIYGMLGSGLFGGEFLLIGGLQALAALSMFFLYKYNGEKGTGPKYLFYGFYPVHLLILGLISKLVG